MKKFTIFMAIMIFASIFTVSIFAANMSPITSDEAVEINRGIQKICEKNDVNSDIYEPKFDGNGNAEIEFGIYVHEAKLNISSKTGRLLKKKGEDLWEAVEGEGKIIGKLGVLAKSRAREAGWEFYFYYGKIKINFYRNVTEVVLHPAPNDRTFINDVSLVSNLTAVKLTEDEINTRDQIKKMVEDILK